MKTTDLASEAKECRDMKVVLVLLAGVSFCQQGDGSS